ERTTRNPQSHAAASSPGSTWITLGETVEGVAREITVIAGCEKGWLTSSIAKYKPAFVRAEPRDHGRCLPMATSSEMPTRNYIDAASHSQYRARAWLLLKISV